MARLFGQQQTAIFRAGRRGQVVVAAGSIKMKQKKITSRTRRHMQHGYSTEGNA